jgi:hypothetical protein
VQEPGPNGRDNIPDASDQAVSRGPRGLVVCFLDFFDFRTVRCLFRFVVGTGQVVFFGFWFGFRFGFRVDVFLLQEKFLLLFFLVDLLQSFDENVFEAGGGLHCSDHV